MSVATTIDLARSRRLFAAEVRALRPKSAFNIALTLVAVSIVACDGTAQPARQFTSEDIAFASRFADDFAASVADTEVTADILEVAVDNCLHAPRAAEQRRGCERMTDAGERHGKEVDARERLFAAYVARFGDRPLDLDDDRASDAERTFLLASETLRVLLDRMTAQNERVNEVLRRTVMEQRYAEE